MQSNHPHTLFLLIAMSMAFALGACNAGNTSPAVVFPPTLQPSGAEQTANIPTTGNVCDNALFPVRQGASWTYFSTGSPSGDFTYTDTITEVHAEGFTLHSQLDALTRTQAWSCEPDGLKALQLGGGTTASISIQAMTAEFTTIEANGISLPREINAGEQWQHNLIIQGSIAMPTDQQAQSNGTYSVTMQAAGTETITVPAGTFEALKIQATSAVQIDANFQGVPVPITINGSSVLWYAPGIGFIKSIENSDFSGSPYTATTELQTYYIP